MTIAQSAQPCGCDPGMDWLCERHREASFTAEELTFLLEKMELGLSMAENGNCGISEMEQAVALLRSRR